MAPIHVADPEQYILQLLSGWPADQYEQALRHNKDRLHENGFGVGIDDGDHYRGRVYLPWAGCRDCSPYADVGKDTHADAIKFGTSRNPAAWRREVQLIADKGNGPNTGFVWKWTRDGNSPVVDDPPYVPKVAYVEPVPDPPIVVTPPVNQPPAPTDLVEVHRKLDTIIEMLKRPPSYKGIAGPVLGRTADIHLTPEA